MYKQDENRFIELFSKLTGVSNIMCTLVKTRNLIS